MGSNPCRKFFFLSFVPNVIPCLIYLNHLLATSNPKKKNHKHPLGILPFLHILNGPPDDHPGIEEKRTADILFLSPLAGHVPSSVSFIGTVRSHPNTVRSRVRRRSVVDASDRRDMPGHVLGIVSRAFRSG